MTTVRQWLLPSSTALLLGLALLGCGGTGTDADRKAARPAADAGTLPVFVDDPRRQPVYSCDEDKPARGIVATHSIEDWETGAGAGWYTNNDQCEGCQPAIDAINASIDGGNLADPLGLDAGLVQRAACIPACVASQTPSYFAKPTPADTIPGGRCGSKYAFHVISGPFSKWGGQLGINFSPPIDSTILEGETFDGISFWARVAPGSRSAIRIQVGESHTDAKYPEPPGTPPPCVADTNRDDTSNGCDSFGSYVDLNSDWHFFALPFEEMRQAGWGKRAAFFDIQHISNLTFFYTQGSWDIWLDDIAFCKQGPQ